MKIRFISDIHAGLNMTYAPTEFVEYMKKLEPADYTLIAGDMDADIDEAATFLKTYFKNKKVIFVAGNHVCYGNRNTPLLDLLDQYKKEFNGDWKFLENDYVWLNDDIAVIGCIGWTDYKYHSYKEYHSMTDESGRPVDQEGKLLPVDPTETPEFKAELKKIWNEEKFNVDVANQKMTDLYRSVTPGPSERVDTTFKNRVSEEVYNNYINWFEGRSRQGKKEYSIKDYVNYNKSIARRCMNDFHYGRMSEISPITREYRYMTPDDCEKFHKESKKYIEFAYNKIVEKNPNATIILMTHHPFTKKCESAKYRGEPLNAAFISDEDKWLKKFPNIKYLHCGHVHSRCFDKTGNKQIIANPMGYLAHYEDRVEPAFNINYILDI